MDSTGSYWDEKTWKRISELLTAGTTAIEEMYKRKAPRNGENKDRDVRPCVCVCVRCRAHGQLQVTGARSAHCDKTTPQGWFCVVITRFETAVVLSSRTVSVEVKSKLGLLCKGLAAPGLH